MDKPKTDSICTCGYKGKEHSKIEVCNETIYVCPTNESGIMPEVFSKMELKE